MLSTEQLNKLKSMLCNETDMGFRRRALTIFDFLDLSDSDSLLECGCGRGFYLNMIRELYNCKLSGVELDLPVVKIAHAKMLNRNTSVLRSNIQHLPFKDQSFSRVLFSEVLEHIPDDHAALREIHRVLAPNGIMALTVPNARYPLLWDPINRVLEDLFNSPIRSGVLSGIWANHERLYKLEDLKELVQKCGFAIEEVRHLVYFCFPFAHNIVYGIGKELLERGLLPKSVATASDRFSYNENTGSLLNPVNLMRKVFLAIDRLNDIFPPTRSSVVIALKLRKL